MMTTTAVLEDLHRPPPFFPAAALRAAVAQQAEITPALLDLLASVRARAVAGGESDDLAWLYALFLLAQFRERRAYPVLVELASLPSSVVESLFGDVLTEDLAGLLASVAQGDPTGLHRLIENEGADLFARSAAVRALVIQVKLGEQPREEALAYLGSLLRGKLKREPSFFWGSLLSDCLDLYPEPIREEVEQAFADGLDGERVCSPQDLAKTLAQGQDQVLSELQHNGRYTLLSDAVAALEWWACFQPEEASRPVEPLPTTPVEPYRRARPKVGRNEPCPCGSGRKFKKCCGAV
jgi:Protein of unknown function (DUF1186)/SEC-C motif